jgi:hypothetical protein
VAAQQFLTKASPIKFKNATSYVLIFAEGQTDVSVQERLKSLYCKTIPDFALLYYNQKLLIATDLKQGTPM